MTVCCCCEAVSALWRRRHVGGCSCYCDKAADGRWTGRVRRLHRTPPPLGIRESRVNAQKACFFCAVTSPDRATQGVHGPRRPLPERPRDRQVPRETQPHVNMHHRSDQPEHAHRFSEVPACDIAYCNSIGSGAFLDALTPRAAAGADDELRRPGLNDALQRCAARPSNNSEGPFLPHTRARFFSLCVTRANTQGTT